MGAPPVGTRRGPGSLWCGVRRGPWLLPRRDALHVDGGHGPCARDVLLSRAFRLHGGWRLLCGDEPRVRDALLPYDDALLPAWT